MARHSGKNGLVKLAAGAVVALTGWDIEESVSTIDLTAVGDSSKSHTTDIGGWSGSIKMNADHAAAGQTLRAGDSVAFEGYTEGSAVGKTFFSGTITILTHGVDSPMDGAVTRSYSFEGNGDLTIAAVI